MDYFTTQSILINLGILLLFVGIFAYSFREQLKTDKKMRKYFAIAIAVFVLVSAVFFVGLGLVVAAVPSLDMIFRILAGCYGTYVVYRNRKEIKAFFIKMYKKIKPEKNEG